MTKKKDGIRYKMSNIVYVSIIHKLIEMFSTGNVGMSRVAISGEKIQIKGGRVKEKRTA